MIDHLMILLLPMSDIRGSDPISPPCFSVFMMILRLVQTFCCIEGRDAIRYKASLGGKGTHALQDFVHCFLGVDVGAVGECAPHDGCDGTNVGEAGAGGA